MPDLSLKNLKHKFWGTSRRSFGCMKEAQRRERNRHTESRRGDGKKFWVLFETTQSSAWRRQWHPTPALLPGKSHGQRSPVGCSPWGREESDTTEWLTFHFSLSCTGEGNGNPLQTSCLENPRDGGAWWAAVHGVARSQTRLSDLPFTFHFHALEKEMATHSSVLAWRIPGMEGAWWATVYGIAQSQTWLKRLSSRKKHKQ